MFYSPSEDTFLLEDAIRSSLEVDVSCIVEVGCGSGYISNILRSVYPLSHIISTDINPYAVRETYSLCNSTNTTVIRSSIIEGIRCPVDMAVFNPPYLPSEQRHLEGEWIDRSWAGGAEGMEITNKFLKETSYIRIRYIVLSQYNNPSKVIEDLKQKHSVQIIAQQKILNEHLYVIRIEQTQ